MRFMTTELWVFNKQREDGWVDWNEEKISLIEEGELSYSVGRFRSKISIFKDFFKELNFIYKENHSLNRFFEDGEIKVRIYKNYHHIVSFDPVHKTLNLDSKLNPDLVPVYLFSFYYALSRANNISEDAIFLNFASFFASLEKEYLIKLTSLYSDSTTYDSGSHFYKFLSKLSLELNEETLYRETQLLRRRSYIGILPLNWDLSIDESLVNSYSDNLTQALTANSFKYEERMISSSNIKEILSEASETTIVDRSNIELELKKLESSLRVAFSSVDNSIEKHLIAANFYLQDILFLCSAKSAKYKEFMNSFGLFAEQVNAIFEFYFQKAEKDSKFYDKSYSKLNNHHKNVMDQYNSLRLSLQKSYQQKETIYLCSLDEELNDAIGNSMEASSCPFINVDSSLWFKSLPNLFFLPKSIEAEDEIGDKVTKREKSKIAFDLSPKFIQDELGLNDISLASDDFTLMESCINSDALQNFKELRFLGANALEAEIMSYENKFIDIFGAFSKIISRGQIKAMILSYGIDFEQWKALDAFYGELSQFQFKQLKESLEASIKELKKLQLLYKSKAFEESLEFDWGLVQDLDCLVCNGEKNKNVEYLNDLVLLSQSMKVSNKDSRMLVIDSSTNTNSSIFGYDQVCEWVSLGGAFVSSEISLLENASFSKKVESEKLWAKKFLNLILSGEELAFEDLKKQAKLEYPKIKEAFANALKINAPVKILERYKVSMKTLLKVSNYEDILEIDFSDWLVLGGRWVLNGESRENLEYVVDLFTSSEKLRTVIKKDYENLELFVSSMRDVEDIIASNKRAFIEKESSGKKIYMNNRPSSLSKDELYSLFASWDATVQKLEALIVDDSYIHDSYIKDTSDHVGLDNADAKSLLDKMSNILGEVLASMLYSAQEAGTEGMSLVEFEKDLLLVKQYLSASNIPLEIFKEIIFGKKDKQSIYKKIAANASANNDLLSLSKLGEMLYLTFLLSSISHSENEISLVNNIKTFFSNYLNHDEVDYVPYLFMNKFVGDIYGIDDEHYLNLESRQRVFELACKTGDKIYKFIHFFISTKTSLKETGLKYRDFLIGDFSRGIVPMFYQHETICLEERFWDCMRALADCTKSLANKAALPVIIKNAAWSSLFPQQLSNNKETEQVAIVALANTGATDFDELFINSSFAYRSKLEFDYSTGLEYSKLLLMAPYLTNEGKINKFMSSFDSEVLSVPDCDYIFPFENASKGLKYDLNNRGFINAMVVLKDFSKSKLPKPDLLCASKNQLQYVQGKTLEWGVPEICSKLGSDLLEELPGLSEKINQNSFEVPATMTMNSHAKSLVNPSFIERLIAGYVNNEVVIKKTTPRDFMSLMLRAYQTINGNKGLSFYFELSSANSNHFEKKKVFTGEPIELMPPFIANRIHKLVDEYGDALLKEFLPVYAKEYAIDNDIKIIENSSGFSNAYTLSAVFDFVPYIFVVRHNSEGVMKKYKVDCVDNLSGGLDYFYIYNDQKILIASGDNHEDSLVNLEKVVKETIASQNSAQAFEEDSTRRPELIIDIGLALLNINRNISDFAFISHETLDEWCRDWAVVARDYQLKRNDEILV